MEFARTASSLVAGASADACNVTGGVEVSRLAQNCVLGVRDNWQWLSTLMKCSETHLKHASEYHQVTTRTMPYIVITVESVSILALQFFHQAKEFDVWMTSELKRALQTMESVSTTNDIHKLILTTKVRLKLILLHGTHTSLNTQCRCRNASPSSFTGNTSCRPCSNPASRSCLSLCARVPLITSAP